MVFIHSSSARAGFDSLYQCLWTAYNPDGMNQDGWAAEWLPLVQKYRKMSANRALSILTQYLQLDVTLWNPFEADPEQHCHGPPGCPQINLLCFEENSQYYLLQVWGRSVHHLQGPAQPPTPAPPRMISSRKRRQRETALTLKNNTPKKSLLGRSPLESVRIAHG